MLIQRIALTFLLSFSIWTSSSAENHLTNNNPPSGLTPLTRAIRLEKFDEAKKHITPELVNKMDQGQYHPLTYAAYTSNNELIETLLKAGADPNVVEHNGKTALYVAANMANIEGIQLLHKHGAKRPAKTALSPAIAAVYSSDLDTLKTLLTFYPNIDLNRGWKSASRWDGFQLGCAVNYAAHFGYDGIARYLLSKNALVTGRDYYGQNALDHAVINRHCSVELVQDLLAAGHSPIRKYHSRSDNSPNTPLASAVVGGDINKVKAMTSNLDPKTNYLPISKAAQVAAAHNNEEITEYLLNLLGENILAPDQYLTLLRKNHTDRQIGDSMFPPKKNKATAIQAAELDQIMPRSTPRTSTTPAQGTIAIIASAPLKNSALLLTSALSQHNGITLLERDSIDKLLIEKSLKSFQHSDSAALHKNLNLIPANHVIILTKESVNKKSFAQLILIDTSCGIVTSRFAIPLEEITGDIKIKQLTSLLLNAMTRSGSTKTAISMASIKPNIPTEKSHAIADLINTTLPFHISNTPDCISLTRKQLQHLETEKAIGAKGSYWTAAWVVDGGIRTTHKNGIVTITLRATNTSNKQTVTTTKTAHNNDISKKINELWLDLAMKLNLGVPQPRKSSTAVEIQILTQYAQWLFDANYPEEALNLLNNCRALGDDSQKTHMLSLRARLATLPVSKFRKTNYGYSPRSRNIIKVFEATKHIHDYQALCDTALLYTNSINSKLPYQTNFPRIKGHSGLSLDGHLNGYISQAIYELCFFRNMMDHVMIYKAHSKTLHALDANIANLTKTYLRKTQEYSVTHLHSNGNSTRSYTLDGLLRGDLNYYAIIQPDLFEEINTHIWPSGFNPIYKRDPAQIMAQRTMASSKMVNSSAFKSWSKIFNETWLFAKTSNLYHLYVTKIHSYKFRDEKLSHAKKLIPIFNKGGMSYSSLHSENRWLGIELNHLLGVENHSFRYPIDSDKLPPGGILAYPLQNLDQIKNTNEFFRQYGFYLWAESLNRRKNLKQFLKESIAHDTESKASSKFNKIEWQRLQQLHLKYHEATNDNTSLFNKLTGNSKKEKNTNPSNAITLPPPILFPPSSTHPDLGLVSRPHASTLDRDELWVPVFFKEQKKIYRTGRSNRSNYHHAIQIISLTQGTTQTITIPDKLPVRYHTGPNPITLGKKFAYYQIDSDRLCAIDRKTHQIKEIELPLPYIHNISRQASGDNLTVSLTLEKKSPLRSSKQQANLVVTIQGDKIINTLVSNRRKPPESPLDDPNLIVSIIDDTPDAIHMVAKSSSKSKDLATSTTTGATYNKHNQNWKSLSTTELASLESELYKKHFQAPIESKKFELGSQKFYLTSAFSFAGRLRQIPLLSITSNEIYAKKIQLNKDVLKDAYAKLIPLTAPVIDSALFKMPTQMVRLNNAENDGTAMPIDDPPYSYQGWWYSPNDLIKKKLFSVHVIAQWRDNYLISLHHKNNGFPAIWIVPKNTIKKHLTMVLEQSKTPISFNDLPSGPFTKQQYPQLTITAEKDHAEIYKKKWLEKRFSDQSNRPEGISEYNHQIHLKRNKSQITVTPKKPLISKIDLAMNVSRYHRRTKTIEAKLCISVETNGQWKEIYKGIKFGVNTFNLPSGTTKIRITNESPKGAGILIDDILIN